MAVWLPGYTVLELGATGGAYDMTVNPKLCWHTTEGSTLGAAESAFYKYPPHLGVDPDRNICHQYVPLDRRAYSLGNSDAEDSFVIQVEVVGFASESHDWPPERLEWLGRHVAGPVHDAVGVPPVACPQGFHGEGEGMILASSSSPIRMTLSQWDSFAGHVGHQHCRLDIATIVGPSPAPEPEPEEEETMGYTICAAVGDGDQYITDMCTFKRRIAGEDDWNNTVLCVLAAGNKLYYKSLNDPVRVPRETLDHLPTVHT
jgi:hypothetical protein